jgi:hypothetical protein
LINPWFREKNRSCIRCTTCKSHVVNNSSPFLCIHCRQEIVAENRILAESLSLQVLRMNGLHKAQFIFKLGKKYRQAPQD